ncbi:SpoIID/LytB domain-containing protein [Thermoclostridium stercorarium]|uniref:SpoIID/LytB domain-containing protein n=1 Tax=Thermoclostridium stercorarium TaxID=1510 RepID=UPI000A9496C9|nr:SpoIID/LytB domain-containing protein [Thermoclostridium stercorarium]
MRNNRKALVLLLVVCLLIFLSVSRNIRKEEEQNRPEGEEEKRKQPVYKTEIIVYDTRNKVIERMDLDEYIVGVVAAEMPASFEMEALKAQAIAARTYASEGRWANTEAEPKDTTERMYAPIRPIARLILQKTCTSPGIPIPMWMRTGRRSKGRCMKQAV